MIDQNALAAAQRLTAAKNGVPLNPAIIIQDEQGAKLAFPQVAVHLITDQAVNTIMGVLVQHFLPLIEGAVRKVILELAENEHAKTNSTD